MLFKLIDFILLSSYVRNFCLLFFVLVIQIEQGESHFLLPKWLWISPIRCLLYLRNSLGKVWLASGSIHNSLLIYCFALCTSTCSWLGNVKAMLLYFFCEISLVSIPFYCKVGFAKNIFFFSALTMLCLFLQLTNHVAYKNSQDRKSEKRAKENCSQTCEF